MSGSAIPETLPKAATHGEVQFHGQRHPSTTMACEELLGRIKGRWSTLSWIELFDRGFLFTPQLTRAHYEHRTSGGTVDIFAFSICWFAVLGQNWHISKKTQKKEGRLIPKRSKQFLPRFGFCNTNQGLAHWIPGKRKTSCLARGEHPICLNIDIQKILLKNMRPNLLDGLYIDLRETRHCCMRKTTNIFPFSSLFLRF